MTSSRFIIGFPRDIAGRPIRRIDDRCTDCGVCGGFCPAKCFTLEEKTGAVIFDNRHCAACGFCLRACPRQAMEIVL